jgi:hypothetical protein
VQPQSRKNGRRPSPEEACAAPLTAASTTTAEESSRVCQIANDWGPITYQTVQHPVRLFVRIARVGYPELKLMAGPCQRQGLLRAVVPVCNLCASPRGSPRRPGNSLHPLSPNPRIITGVQARMARAALQWSVGEVARAADVPLIAVKRPALQFRRMPSAADAEARRRGSRTGAKGVLVNRFFRQFADRKMRNHADATTADSRVCAAPRAQLVARCPLSCKPRLADVASEAPQSFAAVAVPSPLVDVRRFCCRDHIRHRLL